MLNSIEEIDARNAVADRLWKGLTKSIEGAPSAEAAARYCVNRLTAHELELLAEVAVTFARDEVLKALGTDGDPDE
jgi:hypothetical protein